MPHTLMSGSKIDPRIIYHQGFKNIFGDSDDGGIFMLVTL